jgi:uncharacterized membrane protein YbaN (DUF454 family)
MLLVGWVFSVLGVVGLFLPFLQGILFILIGLAILSGRSKTVRRWLQHIEKRFPQLHEKVLAWQERVKKWFQRGDGGPTR